MTKSAAIALTSANFIFYNLYFSRFPRSLNRKALLARSPQKRKNKDLQTEVLKQSMFWRRYVYPLLFLSVVAFLSSISSILYLGQFGFKNSAFAQGALVASSLCGTAFCALGLRLFWLERTVYRRTPYDSLVAFNNRRSLFRLALQVWLTITIYRILVINGSLFLFASTLHAKIMPGIAYAWSVIWSFISTTLVNWIVSGIVGNAAFRVVNNMTAKLKTNATKSENKS